ncbi:MAG: error-prone DNA polymerase [Verrucomicrobiales bacterium]|nr:error-prone DNA polymerase [Verrucomicrobiales bacterium]
MKAPPYIELHASSAFSFLRGGTLPETLMDRAGALGLPALAVCDRMGVYGAARQAGMAASSGVRPIYGAELWMEDDSVLPVLVQDRTGYQNLCRLLSTAHLRSAKGEGRVHWEELPEFAPGLVALTGDDEGPLARALLKDGATAVRSVALADRGQASITATAMLDRLIQTFGRENVYVEVQRHLRRGEDRLNEARRQLAERERLPLLATNGVLYGSPEGREVADLFTCLRHHTDLDSAGRWLAMNGERHLKSAADMAQLFADLPSALDHTLRLADRLRFDLQDLGYEFPRYPVGAGETMEGVLREWVYRGAAARYAGAIPDPIRQLLHKELALIHKLGFAGYFLIVADLVRFCREQDILVQGRGSAANSAVCFCLGITAVDPVKFHVLFERFLSEGRKGWPDIDLDLPSGDRRERVIQEVFRRYGPHGAAMTATVITYRGRSTARELGKALGFPADTLDRFSALFGHGDFPHTLELLAQMEKAGLSRSHPRAEAFARIYQQMARLPRHLGQHSGGMIICQDALHRVVPLENAAMPGRVVCQWDKDDCEDLGIIKVDLLGLGMMAALQDALKLTEQRGRPVDLAQLPKDDPATFELMRRAETIGVFQIESRAQMATLPRLKPACFYDLVIEVAIIRPGPIQGDLAHPFLRRREGSEAVTYWDPKLEPVLKRTLGVPLFQEQMLQIAMVMADFTGEEAEELRKALSFHRSDERMERSRRKLKDAMIRKGVTPLAAEQISKAVGSFALYGFPESHAISFAHLAYASAYLKVHRPAEFFCALLNHQPMGFYSPATLVRDAKRRGLRVRPVCVQRSQWLCTLESDSDIRLGFKQVQGLRRPHAERLEAERALRPFESMDDFLRRCPMPREELRMLSTVGALNGLAPHRRAALWQVERPIREADLFASTSETGRGADAQEGPLKAMTPWERTGADYEGLRMTTGPHPMSYLRETLPGVWRASDLANGTDGEWVRVAGQVICRQRPGTAKGVCFLSLEDETGIANVIVAPQLFEDQRLKITLEPFLVVEGRVQRRHGTVHVQAARLEGVEQREILVADSHDFR